MFKIYYIFLINLLRFFLNKLGKMNLLQHILAIINLKVVYSNQNSIITSYAIYLIILINNTIIISLVQLIFIFLILSKYIEYQIHLRFKFKNLYISRVSHFFKNGIS